MTRWLCLVGGVGALRAGVFPLAAILLTYALVSMHHAHRVRKHGRSLVRTGTRRAITGRL